MRKLKIVLRIIHKIKIKTKLESKLFGDPPMMLKITEQGELSKKVVISKVYLRCKIVGSNDCITVQTTYKRIGSYLVPASFC